MSTTQDTSDAATEPAASSLPLVLDAVVYPHLIDIVFAHADAPGLLYLRTACRAWYERSSKILATSHTVVIDEGPAYAVVNGALVRHFHPYQHAPDRATSLNLTPAILPDPWVVDLLAYREDVERSDGVFINGPPKFLRLWENGSRDRNVCFEPGAQINSDTVVVFAWPSQGPIDDSRPCLCPKCEGARLELHGRCEVRPCFRCCNMGNDPHPYLADKTALADVGPGVRKVVLNLSLASKPVYEHASRLATFHIMKWPGSLKEVVVNWVSPVGPREVGDSDYIPDRIAATLDVMMDCAYNPDFTELKYTFVNFESLPQRVRRRMLSGWDDAPDSRAAFQSDMPFAECVGVFFTEFGVEAGNLRKVEFLSSTEYEARVGRETFRLETMERPWEAAS